jgi:hypothetical protein
MVATEIEAAQAFKRGGHTVTEADLFVSTKPS